MTYYTGLARVLRNAGLKVVEVPGWKTRGHGGMGTIKGILAHHTAGPHRSRTSSNYPSLGIVRDGRAGLPGPLAQLGIGYDGTWYVIAAGLAYHSGRVDNPSYGNAHALGIEAENPGDGSPWPQEQYDSYVRGVAALIAEWDGKIGVRGHKEAAVPKGRKIDPTFDMGKFRRDVAKCDLGNRPAAGGAPAGGTTPPTTKKDWFDMATKKDLEDAVWAVLNRDITTPGGKRPLYALIRDGSYALTAAQDAPAKVWTQDLAIGGATKSALGRDSLSSASLLRYAAAAAIEGRTQHADLRARLAAVQAALHEIATQKGVDADKIDAAINKAVTDALKDLKITLTTED